MPNQNSPAPAKILLVEDTEADIKITLKAFKKASYPNTVFVVSDGQEALDFLRHEGAYVEAARFPRPDLILLDINMPRMDGFMFLDHIRPDAGFKSIPVVVLTSSNNEEDVQKSLAKGANKYIQKPVDYNEFVQVVESLGGFLKKI